MGGAGSSTYARSNPNPLCLSDTKVADVALIVG